MRRPGKQVAGASPKMYGFQNYAVPSLQKLYSSKRDESFYEWRRVGARDKIDNIIAMLGEHARGITDVLEVGCGTGAVLGGLARKQCGARHVGIDVSDVTVTEQSDNYTFSKYDGKTIPFPDKSFDLVYATHVLEHVLDERGFLGELARVSRLLVYVEVPCEVHMRTSFKSLQQSLAIGHINAYTPETFALKLETSGLYVTRLGLFEENVRLEHLQFSSTKALVKSIIRKSLLVASGKLASRVFTYHCGALCLPTEPLKLTNNVIGLTDATRPTVWEALSSQGRSN
jgi:SAM-dependent methyltransferase